MCLDGRPQLYVVGPDFVRLLPDGPDSGGSTHAGFVRSSVQATASIGGATDLKDRLEQGFGCRMLSVEDCS